ncbi:MAG TPA: diguanylate cyclase [Thermoanaerobaculia bacterium]|nr:diguanylate cyclase [Thermoanaerobaculia bacterium]
MSIRFLRRSTRRAALPLVALLMCASIYATERGVPLITVYPAEVHKAGPQSFDIAQDSRGILYFGNLQGLLSYDGAWWRLLKLPDDQAALSVAADSKGRIALGLVSDFGYVVRSASGGQEYRSLLPKLPADKRAFGDVAAICTTANGFLFLTEKSLLLWDGTNARVAAEFQQPNAPRGCLSEGSEILLRGPVGLQRFDLATNAITNVALTGQRVLLTVRRGDGKIVAAVRDQGLFLIDGTTATPWASEATAWLKGKRISGGTRLADGRLAITTGQHGLVILDANGTIQQIIGFDAGLPDALLNEVRVDHEGSLWLAMEGPLVRVDLASPVTVFDVRRGLRGGAGDVAFHAGRVYAAMTHGLYVIQEDGTAKRVEGMEEGAWRLRVVDEELLVGTTKGIYRVDRNGALTLLIERDGEMYDLTRSTNDPSRVWLAQGEGVSSIRREGNTWKFERVIPGTPTDISNVVERDGVLWAGTVFNGIIRIDDPRGSKPRVKQFGSGEMNVYDVNGRVVFVRANGEILQIDRDGFVPDPLLGHIAAPRGFFVIASDLQGDLWINSTPPRVFEQRADGTFAREGRPLVSVTAADIQNLRVLPDGVVWFASDKGLFRYERTAAEGVVAPQPAPLIQRVVAGEDRVLFDVAARREPTELKHNFGRIRIEFAPVSYRPGVSYQYRLDPIDETWSEWSNEPFIDYTTLEPNDYTFRLRARGPAMVASAETQWSFSVLPPWYRTPLAHALMAIVALAVLLGVIRMRTGTLRRQAERLRKRVDEQTAELQQTVQLLEAANTQLEALSLEDDLTGIANRRSFERALADEWNRAKRHEQPLALVLLDLDYFKDLNDRRGHPAGDDCLRKVGAFLSNAIKRSGEIVARYGGEEFAILLPGVEADIALRVAETLRDGIERLAIPYGTGSRRMTASCGVAAMTPRADASAEMLVASADRALYAAKHSGRNIVRLADETTTGTWLRDVSA